MLNRLLHHPGLRLLAAIFGTLLCAVGVNLFIVPLGFYTGGLMGFCQILRTLLLSGLNFSFGTFDMAGILYFLINIPILLYAWRALGRGMVLRTLICTVTSSLFYAVVPIPSAPIMEDPLTACLLGGIFVGVGSGVREEAFTSQFIGKTPPLTLNQDIDAVSGATLSSQAAVDAVNEAYAFLKAR